MKKYIKGWQRRESALAKIKHLDKHRINVLIIHYSCESFYDLPPERTSRITSIAVRNFDTAQTVSFSIHESAERYSVPLNQIDAQYDRLERSMLDSFFDYIRPMHGFFFVHWNMRDQNYGFQAIERRFRALGGDPFVIADVQKYDLARILVARYGVNYIEHENIGRFYRLFKLNGMTDRDALNGAEEARAFEDKRFVELHRSTLRKVDIISDILERTIDGSLKTDASRIEMNVPTFTFTGFVHPAIIVGFINSHWLWKLFGIVATIIGALAGVVGIFTWIW